jgi:CBS domain-containing protein
VIYDPARMKSTRIGTIVSKDVLTVATGARLSEVVKLLLDSDLDGAPVVDKDGTLVGMVSAFDILRKPGERVGDVMSRGVVSVEESAAVSDVIDLMSLHGVRQIPVMANGALIGVVSRTDLFRFAVGKSAESVGE